MQANNNLSADAGKVRYAFENGVWFIKLLGTMCYPVSPTLNYLVDKVLHTQGSNGFVVDLSEVDTIDSTCLGILTRLATRPAPAGSFKPIMITGKGMIAKMVMVLRFDKLFEVVASADTAPQQTTTVQEQSIAPKEMLHLLLDAHRQLCTMDANNHEQFRDVVMALEAEATKQS